MHLRSYIRCDFAKARTSVHELRLIKSSFEFQVTSLLKVSIIKSVTFSLLFFITEQITLHFNSTGNCNNVITRSLLVTVILEHFVAMIIKYFKNLIIISVKFYFHHHHH